MLVFTINCRNFSLKENLPMNNMDFVLCLINVAVGFSVQVCENIFAINQQKS